MDADLKVKGLASKRSEAIWFEEVWDSDQISPQKFQAVKLNIHTDCSRGRFQLDIW